MQYRRLCTIFVTSLLLLVLVTPVTQPVHAQSGGVAHVSLTGNGFDPATLTIVLGTQVRWTNHAGATYTLSTGNLAERSVIYLPIIQAWSRAARATAATSLLPQDSGDKFSVTLLPDQSYSHTFTRAGTYPYQAGSFKGTVIVTEPTQLVLFHIGDSTLPMGNTLNLQLRGYDPSGAPITFAVGPLPLPTNMTLNSNTGAFVFRPAVSQVGLFPLTFQALTSAGVVATEQVTIQVTGPGGIEQTGVRGRILDANAIARGEIKPLVGATVTHLDSGRTVTTDSNGYFALIGLTPGVNHFDYNGATAIPVNTYGGYRAKMTLLAGVTHEIERPLYIMQIDKAAETQVDPTTTTVVENPSLKIDLTIPAHTVMDDDGSEYAGNISVSQVPVGFTPAALPATMEPALVVTIQPMGLTFDQPAPITFENIMGLKPGENVNIWSMDHASGQFFVAGVGQVSADGARIETIEGGIREASWHFPLPPPPPVADTPDQDSDNSDHPDKCECATGSTTSMRDGALTTDFSLPFYRTLGEARSLTFVYASAHAYPYKSIPLDVSTDPASYPGGAEDLIMPIADLFSYNLTVGGVTQGKETFFTAPTNSVVRIAPSFSANSFQTGVYQHIVKIQGTFQGASPLLPFARVSTARVGHTIVVNEQQSVFGAGWGIAGLQRLYVQPDKTALVVDGSGASQRFAIGLAGTPRQPLLAAKGALVAATLADGIHVVGGADTWSGSGVTTTHVVYDPVTNGWSTRAPAPDNNVWGPASAVVAGKLYLFGGWSSGDQLTRVYDPATDAWTARAAIPTPGFNYGHAAAVVNNQVYVVGGTNGSHLFRYDPTTDAWTTDLAAIPTNQSTLAAGVIAGEIYVVGVGTQLQIYNPATNTWRQGAPLPLATLRPSVAVVNNKLYLFGGSTDDRGGDIRAVQVYDPATDTWEQRLELSGARSWSAAAVYNNDVYVIGGFNQDNNGTALNEFVTLTTSSAPRWHGPDGDYSTLQLLVDGTAVRSIIDGTQIRFNAKGLQTAVVDRNGNTTTYLYDAQDRLLTMTDPVGQVMTLTYSGSHLQKVVDPAGRTTSFAHDGAGNLIQVTFPDGSTRAFGYDGRHLMTSETDPRGKITTRTFDWAGRMISALLPDGSRRKVTNVQGAGAVDPATGLGTVEEPVIVAPAPTANTLIDGQGLTTTITTGRFGEITLITGPDGLSTTMERDSKGNATTVRLPNGAEYQMTYDHNGNVSRFTDFSVGGATTYQYEQAFNQVTTITDPQGYTTNIAYDGTGNPKKIETALGQTVVFTYNTQALPSQIQDGLGTITTFAYDSKGNPTALTRLAATEQRQYNMAYTAEGYLQSITDGQGRTVNQTYDPLGRITTQVLPDGNQINYTYDTAGHVTAITPPGRPAHTFTYNDLGLVVAYTPPSVGNDAGPTSYNYNQAQQITQIALPGGQRVDFHYDGAGRLARMTQLRGETRYLYDNTTGNLLEIQSPQGVTLAYQYQYGGRVANVTLNGPVSGMIHSAYDSSGRIYSLAVNQEAWLSYGYNGDGLPVYAAGLSLTYDDQRGLLTNTTLGYVQGNYSYNGFGEVTTHQVQSWDQNSAMMVDRYQAQYMRNNLGWITQKSETIGGATNTYDYTYDLAGRLSTVKKDGVTAATYTYDSNGNRLSDGTNNATYDAQDRLLQYGDTVYTYTANGDLLTRTRNGQTTTYSYDSLNNLINATLPDGRTIDYLIDGHNRRVGKRVGGALVQGFLYVDALNPIAELDGNNNIVSQFVYATHPNVPDFMIKNGNTYRLVLDQLGSPRLVIDHNTGQIMQQLAYDAFGNVLLDTNPGFQPFGFAGGLYDPDTKLLRFGARDYDAEVGRWTAKDPILFDGSGGNVYGYGFNNPVNLVDVTGLEPSTPEDGYPFYMEVRPNPDPVTLEEPLGLPQKHLPPNKPTSDWPPIPVTAPGKVDKGIQYLKDLHKKLWKPVPILESEDPMQKDPGKSKTKTFGIECTILEF